MAAPTRVTVLVAVGFVILAGLTYFFVVNLQAEAVEEASAEQGRRSEAQMIAVVNRLAAEELAADGGDLKSFAARLIALAEANPDLLDIVVVDAKRRVVRRFSRRGGGADPCVARMPLTTSMDGEHAAGELSRHPVACKSVPVISGGESRGAVLFHVERNWGAYGDHVAELIERTALRIAPVLAVSYLLLGILLVVASRAVRKWRARAASFERVEALGALADGINHEIKNPLNAVGLSLQYLARRYDDAETREVVETASREAERIAERLEEFARFTRVSRLETAQTSLGEALRSRLRDHGHLEIRGDARARVDLAKLGGAVTAVLDFLRRCCVEEEGISVTLSESGDEWQMVAEGGACDVGAGDVDRFFDPYVRVRPHDVGRGLALARAVFQAHGGDLVAQLRGSRLTLRGHAPRIPPGEDGT